MSQDTAFGSLQKITQDEMIPSHNCTVLVNMTSSLKPQMCNGSSLGGWMVRTSPISKLLLLLLFAAK